MKIVFYSIALLLCFAGEIQKCAAQFNAIVMFTGFDGEFPGGTPQVDQNLISDGTFLYGMTSAGGTSGIGVIFKVMPDGTGYTKLMDFDGPTNGSRPNGSLLAVGPFLYGMTRTGGTNELGVIFKIKPDGTEYTKLKDFTGSLNGNGPKGSLIYDGTFLYGMTDLGGDYSQGNVFKIKPDGTEYTNLLSFNASMGRRPQGSLLTVGPYLYGMTRDGGTSDLGTIFQIKPDGTGYSTLHSFSSILSGSHPEGSLIWDGTAFYGMTNGGTTDYGSIFKMLPGTGAVTKLMGFGGSNGRAPRGSLISDGTSLYGMTRQGGANNMGILFKVDTNGTWSSLWDFNGNASFPTGSLYSDGTSLYGMTSNGGLLVAPRGTVFKYQLSPTRVNDNLKPELVSMYPNPGNGNFSISLPAGSGKSELSIYNTLGELVYFEKVNTQTARIHTNLKAGLYHVSIVQSSQTLTGTIVVQ